MLMRTSGNRLERSATVPVSNVKMASSGLLSRDRPSDQRAGAALDCR